jgi:hypothetical protein
MSVLTTLTSSTTTVREWMSDDPSSDFPLHVAR